MLRTAALFAFALAAHAADLGPPVGAALPAFSLADQHGVSRTLSSLAGPKGVMLVFYRSADW